MRGDETHVHRGGYGGVPTRVQRKQDLGKRVSKQHGAHAGKGTVSARLPLAPPAAMEEPCKTEGRAFLASQGR